MTDQTENYKLPCSTIVWSEARGRDVLAKPRVNCGGDCAACPWNPKEQARRLREGRWLRRERGWVLRFRRKEE